MDRKVARWLVFTALAVFFTLKFAQAEAISPFTSGKSIDTLADRPAKSSVSKELLDMLCSHPKRQSALSKRRIQEICGGWPEYNYRHNHCNNSPAEC
jgi:hypothetical protein